jgi:hypothetical protein
MFFLLFIAITYYKILQIICILQPFNDHIPYFDLFSQPPFWRQIPQCYHFIFDTSRGRITATAAFCKSSQIFSILFLPLPVPATSPRKTRFIAYCASCPFANGTRKTNDADASLVFHWHHYSIPSAT